MGLDPSTGPKSTGPVARGLLSSHKAAVCHKTRQRHNDLPKQRQQNSSLDRLHCALICVGDVTMISGLPLYKLIFPETEMIRPSYCCALGNCPALPEGIKAVNA
jgi:hypothetical protein